ncbi:hypothetical protein Cme02nite_44800 [Catellatospora methionotrophica]|uniref:Uncharacterized protein n=1 Tax=Catellatospora methionotrophica TaxID=121620 RepID=A0A8J3L843_9ACTN|nr:helix-turn-helix domain-containing protein [Catellatospora methionotrophica]GIG16148.1 hypothetical protein Cme02nite_44800 [Catellatospora methionotrophica]
MTGDRATDALVAARRHADLAEEARISMLEHARARRGAIMAAHQAGMSIRRIAEQLGCSAAVVQTALRLARVETS